MHVYIKISIRQIRSVKKNTLDLLLNLQNKRNKTRKIKKITEVCIYEHDKLKALKATIFLQIRFLPLVLS